LLEWWHSPLRDAAGEYPSQMKCLFGLEACQIFLLQHESDGVIWFNKERFEELSEWVTLLVLLERCPPSLTARTVPTRMGEAERAITLIIKRAQEVGYRSRLFTELPEKIVVRRSPRIKKPVAV
jgi:hypothetical protein